MTNRQHTARAVGAAIGQRAAMADLRPDLDVFRKQALAPPERDGLCVGEVIQNLNAWIGDMAPSVRNTDAPRGVPYAVVGATAATHEGTGSGETWHYGSGFRTLMSCLRNDLTSPTSGFTQDFARALFPVLKLVTSISEGAAS
ncbi:hypothetical protein [Mycobacterium servetii]|uniref:Uncharacterized protein n=1 Tax=Mycobacterium servetii TaxID=3237418 RepID=A0ABV4BUG1_9MYCO